jgi:hypothetical protein
MHFLLININRVQDSRYWFGKKQHADCHPRQSRGLRGCRARAIDPACEVIPEVRRCFPLISR